MNVIRLVPPELGEGAVLDCDGVLEAAKGDLETVVVIGRRKDGGAPYVASSHGQPEMMAEIEIAKHWMLTEIAKVRWGEE